MATKTYLTEQETLTTPADVGGLAKGARWAFLGIVAVLTVMALGQFLLVGVFTFEDPAVRLDHANMGHIFGMLTYLVWIPAALGKMGRKIITGSVVLLVIAHLQYAFIEADSGMVNALHALNGSLILLNCFWLVLAASGMIRRGR